MLSDKEAARKQWLEDAIEAIQNAQMGIFRSGMSSMAFKGRSITNLSPSELDRHRRMFANELEKLEAKERGEPRSRTIRILG